MKVNWSEKRRAIEAKAVSAKELVTTGFPDGGRTLPLLARPALEGVSLSDWARNNPEFIERSLSEYGGVLFRGFDVNTQDGFQQFLGAISLELMKYAEGATPRTDLGGRIYTSTEYPAEQTIALHNELTYVKTWPMKILFCCLQPAERGGETPIADVRRVLKRISPAVVERFRRKGWMLVRNSGEGLSLPWQATYHAASRADVENYCRGAGIEFEWRDGDRLRTRQVRPALARHPRTGELVWFNHVAFWHVSSLDARAREAMLDVFAVEDLPYNTYYGDGSPIEDSVVEELRAAYDAETVAPPWRKGDVLMLDNMLVAHGRRPYAGARRILAAMGEPYSDRGV